MNHILDPEFPSRGRGYTPISGYTILFQRNNDNEIVHVYRYVPNNNIPVLEDVKVVINKNKYQERIKSRRLTKKIKKTEAIPDTCCICLDTLKIGNLVHTTPCNHHYHANCLKKQLCSIGPPKCPMCRHDVREDIK
jgi:hypothetical protein